MRAAAAGALILEGDPIARGLGQAKAAPEMAGAVRAAVHGRLEEGSALLARPRIRKWLEEQRRFTERHAPAALAETRGIAAGFDLPEDELFAYLHLGIIADLAAADGCTAFALAATAQGPMLAKNRDFRGEHAGLQRVFSQRDPAWGGRELLCVGSLGSPGAYSSGMNSDGLALADTHIATDDHGPGWLRYFLMTELLASCTTVAEAIARIEVMPHAGGGSLLLADRSGAIAAVELGHERIGIETATSGWLARTNHFLSAELAARNLSAAGYDPMGATSRARLATIRAALGQAADTLDDGAIRAIMARHTEYDHEGLCRHGEDGDARTISTSIFAPHAGWLVFGVGPPCSGLWHRFGCAPPAGAG